MKVAADLCEYLVNLGVSEHVAPILAVSLLCMAALGATVALAAWIEALLSARPPHEDD